jgi:hypothetical protein
MNEMTGPVAKRSNACWASALVNHSHVSSQSGSTVTVESGGAPVDGGVDDSAYGDALTLSEQASDAAAADEAEFERQYAETMAWLAEERGDAPALRGFCGV